MTEDNFRYYEFGEFRLDAHRRILQKNGETIHLKPRSFDLLCVMVENAGRILEHDELLDMVWEGTFVEQGNLKKTVSALRQALGESPESSEYIITVPRRGYRFGVTVRPMTDEMILIRETRAEIIVEEFEETPEIKTLPPTQISFLDKIKRYKIAFLLISLIATGAILFSGWRYLKSKSQMFSVENVRQTRLLTADNLRNGVISTDGSFFVYTSIDKGNTSLLVKQIETGGTTKVLEMKNTSIWFFSPTPDGKYIYFTVYNRDDASKNGVYRVPTFGGVTDLITDKTYTSLRFSPDGKRLAWVRTFTEQPESNLELQEILTVNPDGSDEKKVITLPLYDLFRGYNWSPDGNSIIYTARRQIPSEKAKSYIAEIPINGGTPQIIMPEQEKFIFFEFSLPDKNSFIVRQREANAETFQIFQYFPASGEMRRVTNDDYNYGDLSLTRDYKTIAATREFYISSIWLSESENFDFKQIASGVATYHSLEWTSDGRLIFSEVTNGKEFVGIMNPDGTQKRLLTKGDDGIRLFPGVARDGKHIVFISSRDGGRQVWRMDLDGRNLTQLTSNANVGEAKLLSDGQTLIYSTYSKSLTWTMDKRNPDGNVVPFITNNMQECDVSYDEKLIACFEVEPETKKIQLFIRDMQSLGIVKKFDIEKCEILHWTRNNSAVTFVRPKGEINELVLQPIDGSAEKILTTVRGEYLSNYDWSPDGKQIALVRKKIQSDAVLIQTNEIR